MTTKLVDYAHEQAEEIMRRFYGSQADWPYGLYNSIVSAIENAARLERKTPTGE